MNTQVIEIKRKQGYLLEWEEIETLVHIYQSNNEMYTPTLSERFGTETDVELYAALLERLEERVSQGHIFYLIYEGGNLIGFNTHHLDETIIKGKSYSTLQVGTTCITPKYHNRGIGSALYARIDDDAQNIYRVDAVTRTTWSTNLRQCHLYEKHGYNKFIIKIDFYGIEGVDSLSFYKLLEKP